MGTGELLGNSDSIADDLSNMNPRLLSQNCNFLKFLLPDNFKRDLDTKTTTPNTEGCPESLVAMSE